MLKKYFEKRPPSFKQYETVWHKKHFDFNFKNLNFLYCSILLIEYSEDDLIEKINKLKEVFFEKEEKVVEAEMDVFFSGDFMMNNIDYLGTTGKGKSFFLPALMNTAIKHSFEDLMSAILKFMSDNQTNDQALLIMNFQNLWDALLKEIQETLLKIENV